MVENDVLDRPVIVRGASSGTRLVENRISGGSVVVQSQTDESLGRVRPSRTLVRGGAIGSERVCVRVDGAEGTILDGARLTCPTALEIGGDSAVGVVGELGGDVRCASRGEVRELARIDATFVTRDGAPIPGVRVGSDGASGPSGGMADTRGVFMGEVVKAVRVCPGLVRKPVEGIELTWSEGTTRRSPQELAGRVVLEAAPAEPLP